MTFGAESGRWAASAVTTDTIAAGAAAVVRTAPAGTGRFLAVVETTLTAGGLVAASSSVTYTCSGTTFTKKTCATVAAQTEADTCTFPVDAGGSVTLNAPIGTNATQTVTVQFLSA